MRVFPKTPAKLLQLVIVLVLFDLIAPQSAPCITPQREPGLCVPLERCKNIYRVVQNRSESLRYAEYIRRAYCTLPQVKRSICCAPSEVESETVELPTECGKSGGDRLSRAKDTEVFQYPWMALLRYRNRKNQIIDACGGSLISKRYVLTAAHCLTNSRLTIDHVRLGEHTRSTEQDCIIYRNKAGKEIERNCADPVEDFGVESVTLHENYSNSAKSNDIALIRLSRDVELSDSKYHIRPICLPVTPDQRQEQLKDVIVTGWGATENRTGSDVLQWAQMKHVDIGTCQQRMMSMLRGVQLTEKQLCAGGGDDLVDSCKGDSGGPLAWVVDHRFVQYGVVSFGIGSCGLRSMPGVYGNVVEYMDWILQNLKP